MREFDRRVRAVGDADWQRPTPCADWTVRDLVNHLVVEQLWVPALLSGATMDEVGDRFDGDQLGAEPYPAWRSAATAAREAWIEPGVSQRTVHLSFGNAPARDYGWQMTLDLAVHGWDLACAIGAD
ncbi:MAG: TIGR03086 family metal-binding protein, partial [Sciscionella sp.]